MKKITLTISIVNSLLLSNCFWTYPKSINHINSGDQITLSFKTDEEILFNADDFPKLRDAVPDAMHARYIWSFGDSLGPVVESRSATYSFSNPGEYIVTLEVTRALIMNYGDNPDDDDDDSWFFNDDDTYIFTYIITITGDSPKLIPQVSAVPILSLSFDNSIIDNSPVPFVFTWKDGVPASYISGLSGTAVDLSGGKALVIDNNTLFGDRREFTISFRARRKNLSQDSNCIFWQGTSNDYQPVLGYFIRKDMAAERAVENTSVYALTSAGGCVTSATEFSDLDLKWHHYAFSFSVSDGIAVLYRDGVKMSQSTVGGAPVNSAITPLYIGYGESVRSGTKIIHSFNGYIDDLRVYDRALTRLDLTTGFDVRHADFHGHTAQWIIVDIPEQIRINPDNKLYAEISGGSLSNPSILVNNRTILQPEEKFILRNSDLPGSDIDYILTIKLLEESDNIIFQSNEPFKKIYSGYPKVGIDENNAIRINGKLFFPVTPWGIGGPAPGNYEDIDTWVNNNYINSLYGQGFWPPPWTEEGYRAYLDYASTKSVMVIGPATKWDGLGNLLNYGNANYPFSKCTDLEKMKYYVEQLKEHDALMMWQWTDEPELYGVDTHQLRSWTLASHRIDTQHLVATNFMGHPYSYVNGPISYWETARRKYTLGYNSLQFGKRKSVVDVLGVDNYPLDGVSDSAPDTMNRLGTLLDTIRDENLNLMPIISYVETADAGNTGDPEHPTPWKPTVEQLKMITWFNVVHEVKGIGWFHYFNGKDSYATSAANYDFMATFTRQINELTPIILGPRVTSDVTLTYSGVGRIDAMLRQYNSKWYLIAVRVSEFAVQPLTSTTPPPPVENYSITAIIKIGSDVNGSAAVYEEGRSIPVVNGEFTDNFEPFAVHIYEIE